MRTRTTPFRSTCMSSLNLMSGYIDDLTEAKNAGLLVAIEIDEPSPGCGDFQLEPASVARLARALPRRQKATSEQDFQSCVFSARDVVQRKRRRVSCRARIVLSRDHVDVSSRQLYETKPSSSCLRGDTRPFLYYSVQPTIRDRLVRRSHLAVMLCERA